MLFLGTIPQEELRTLYVLAKMTVLPSSSEGFPLVLAESGLMQTPVITYGHTGSKEVVVDPFFLPVCGLSSDTGFRTWACARASRYDFHLTAYILVAAQPTGWLSL